METNFEKIKKIILDSNIPLNEQEYLITLFVKAEDALLQPLVDLLSVNPSWIEKINDNFKAKQAALITGDSELWQKIIQEEESQLKELEQ